MTDEPVSNPVPPDGEEVQQLVSGPKEPEDRADLCTCEICRSIPDVSRLLHIPSRDASYGGYPAAFARLELVMAVSDRLSILRCPLCGRLYTDEYQYEYLAGGSEDEYVLTRITPAQAREILSNHGLGVSPDAAPP